MQLVVIHHHLNPGGVTSVILAHLKSLASLDASQRPERILLLSDGQLDGWPATLPAELNELPLERHAVPSLAYDGATGIGSAADRAETLYRDILRVLPPADESILHAHNHSLGKTAAWPLVVRRLAEDGFRFLLQIHDFAEDCRPHNYGHLVKSSDRPPFQWLYPQAEQIHYAVLNGRDLGLLSGAGIPAGRLHSLPNPVAPFGPMPDREEARTNYAQQVGVRPRRLLVYPVRGIRRKNVGESLLWAAALRDHARLAMTLAPRNPAERDVYEHWTRLARRCDLPYDFEIGEALPFKSSLAAADALITTSVAEGFGMVFLETWLAERTLAGRDLPAITADFVAAGIEFPGTSDRLQVPVDWVGESVIRGGLERSAATLAAAYGLSQPSQQRVDETVRRWTADDHIDFARLDLSAQSSVIERLSPATAGRFRDEVLARNPSLAAATQLPNPQDAGTIQRNAEVVRQQFGLRGCGQRLYDVFETLRSAPISPVDSAPSGADHLLDSFLAMDHIHPIRFAELP